MTLTTLSSSLICSFCTASSEGWRCCHYLQAHRLGIPQALGVVLGGERCSCELACLDKGGQIR